VPHRHCGTGSYELTETADAGASPAPDVGVSAAVRTPANARPVNANLAGRQEVSAEQAVEDDKRRRDALVLRRWRTQGSC
jgi:hypothetical protein